MKNSILQTEKECYICKTTIGLHKHHIYRGFNRKISDRLGCWIWLCGYHHNLSDAGIHSNPELDLAVKQECQKVFEETHTREQFMEAFGRNYIFDE